MQSDDDWPMYLICISYMYIGTVILLSAHVWTPAAALLEGYGGSGPSVGEACPPLGNFDSTITLNQLL